jgi:hypothetical protein
VTTADVDLIRQIKAAEYGSERLWSRERGEFLEALNAARALAAKPSPETPPAPRSNEEE